MGLPELLLTTHPPLKNTFLMELEVLPIYEYSQKDAKMVEPFLRLEGLPIADTNIQHHLSRRIKSMAGMLPGYDTVLPPLGQLSQLAASLPTTS